jgi:phage-related tail fiber protein
MTVTINGNGLVTGASSIAPPGAICYVCQSTAPTGWLKADGSAVSRTTYADLFSAIGTTFGSGDGSTTFNVPDFRGEFLRCWDDGKGTDSGRSLGSYQADALKNHAHTVPVNGTGSSAAQATGSGIGTISTGLGGGGTETRPRNYALLAIIKY